MRPRTSSRRARRHFFGAGPSDGASRFLCSSGVASAASGASGHRSDGAIVNELPPLYRFTPIERIAVRALGWWLKRRRFLPRYPKGSVARADEEVKACARELGWLLRAVELAHPSAALSISLCLAATHRIDGAVRAGRMTSDQARRMRQHFSEPSRDDRRGAVEAS